MLFLIALVLAGAFAVLCGKPLKKHPYVFYVIAVLLSVGSVAVSALNMRDMPVFLNQYVIPLFTRGALATAFWCIVMWTGALPNGSAPIRKLMPIRGELSIFAAILTLGHNIGFGQIYFVQLFTNAGSMSASHLTASILTIIMLAIMLLLTVMSFPQVRRKMPAKLWKKLQRTAYLFYALIYTHVLVLYYPMAKAGRAGMLFNILVYSIVFIGYAVCRVRKQVILRKKPETKALLNGICSVVFPSLVGVAVLGAGASQKTDNAISEHITETTEAAVTAVSTEAVSVIETETSVPAVSETETNTESSTEDTESTETATEESSEETEAPEETVPPEDIPEEYVPPEEVVPPPVEDVQPEPPPAEPEYMYHNGTYSASAYGYDGEVFVEVTIENDVITAITARTEESDPWYFESARDSVIAQILAGQNTDVDAVSGATYSSDAIMSAVRQALDTVRT